VLNPCAPPTPRRPHWWPDNEPWPPRRGPRDWRTRRVRFFRTAALLAFVVVLTGLSATAALVWSAATHLGIVSGSAPRGAVVLVAGGGFLGVMATACALFVSMRRIGAPLAAVMDGVAHVADGDYAVRVAERGPGPLRSLARSFNTMAERLERHDRQRRDLMADLSHELRTPLTVMKGTLEGLLDGVYPRDDARLAGLLEETTVLSRLIEDLRTLALSEAGALQLQKEPTDLASLVKDVADGFAPAALAGRVQIDVSAPSSLAQVEIDPVRIRQVIANLIDNALRHTPAGESIVVRIAPTSPGVIQVDVHDTGAGMTPDALAHAFDRFNKGAGSRGSGLGLTIARNLVAAHGGEIHATSDVGRGTTVTFTVPQ
jgi:signal transduction histidine kinase